MKHADCTTSNGDALVLQGISAQGQVVGRMLDMTLEQRFQNPYFTNVEVVYTFPLPWRAVLLGLEVELNGETLVGLVKAKAKARSDYEDALAEGDTSILVTVNHDGSYTLELGNLMAGESCLIRLHYVQILQPEQGSLRLMLPTTIAPRYGDAIRDGGYEPHAAPQVSALADYPFRIALNIQGELAHTQIGSPSHKIAIRSIQPEGTDGSLVAEVSLASHTWLDSDFVLVFEHLPHASVGLAAWDRFDSGLGVVMANFTPRLPTQASLPVSVKVLVDCSGSMNGDSIQAARSALQRILDSLGEKDRFSLSRFGNTVHHRSKAMWKCTPASMAAARRWTQQLEADLGGTEMNGAIASTMALPGSEKSTILLITDGEIHAIDAVVETARRSKHRFFVVGIGTSAAEGLLRRLAEETGGSCEFVSPGEKVEPAIVRLYQRMRTPLITHPRVEWPEGCGMHAASDLPKTVFDGDDVTVFARLRAENAQMLGQSVRLYGQVAGMEGKVLLAEIRPELIADEANTLARLAANQRYWQLKRSGRDVPAMLKKQLAPLAEKYQLVTDDTSLVLVKVRAEEEKAQDMPELRTVQSMLAAGWGGHGSVLAPSVGAMNFVPPDEPLMAVPSVWRTVRNRASMDLGGDLDGFDVPAFLRKQYDEGEQLQGGVWKSPGSKDLFWQLVQDDTGQKRRLSPAGLAEGLKRNPRQVWPTTYQELGTIGVPERVVEWLELILGQNQPEAQVVLAFLEVLSGMDFTLRHAVAGVLRKITGTAGGQVSGLQQVLQERIAQALAGVTASAWPVGVVEYGEVGQ